MEEENKTNLQGKKFSEIIKEYSYSTKPLSLDELMGEDGKTSTASSSKNTLREIKELEKNKKGIKIKDFIPRMDNAFLTTLKNYNKNDKRKAEQTLNFKPQFFDLICDILRFFCAFPFLMIILCWLLDMSEMEIITSVVTSSVEAFTAFLVLPRIIAEYLFNKDEEKNKIELIKSMQDYTREHK